MRMWRVASRTAGSADFAMHAERQDFAKGHEFTRAEKVVPVFSFRGFSH